MSNKLNSFTILEALLSMLILSIIIGLTYSLFTLLNKQMSLFEKENTQVIQYNLFNNTILYDADKAIDYAFNNDVLRLEYYDNTIINYNIKKHYILREKKDQIDTLNVDVIAFDFLERLNNKGELKLTVKLLNDTFETHYFLNKNHSETINEKYFNED